MEHLISATNVAESHIGHHAEIPGSSEKHFREHFMG